MAGMKMAKVSAFPLIGMPAQMDPDSDVQYLNRHYSDSIAESGGLPLVLPLTANAGTVGSVAENLDGILLTGSNSDLAPSLYGALRSDMCGRTQPLRDQMDLFLLEIAFRQKIPVLAICYGIQSLNVFCGGSLIQDISTSINSPLRHNSSNSKDPAHHKILINSGSVLEKIAGGTEIMVNSTHHQAIERSGNNLEIIARAPDGVIEAVFSTSGNHWILGVQWHPEKSFSGDNFSRRLFEFFVARCRAKQEA
jgi:putative glutamine amidotransferase